MKHSLQANFNSKDIVKYTIPTIFMMIFMSCYTIVDGVFVSNFVNETALAAINIVYPAISFVFALSLMLATGANAVIGKLLGERQEVHARQFFTLIYIVGAIMGVLLCALIISFNEPILTFLNADGELFAYAKNYLVTMTFFVPMMVLQIYTQIFFITAGKPSLGFLSCFIGGVTNIILDYVFIVLFNLGISGAALATGAGAAIPAVFGVIYFATNRKCPLHFVRPKWEGAKLLHSLVNGMSEFVTSVSIAVTTLLFNIILMDIAGESGVVAITVILYVQMIQTAIYTGYSFGVSPVISFKYGEQNHAQLQKIMKTSMWFMALASLITVALSFIFTQNFVNIFVPQDSSTFDVATNGFRLFALSYIFMGFNIFASAMFTALSNGKISAFISINRSFVIIVICLLTLPQLMGINGVWLAVPIAELLSFLLCAFMYFRNKSVYNY